jgi:voltage-gated potassium channel
MVLITVSTVGYGEVRPLDSDWLRLLTTLVLLLGLIGNALLIAAAAEILISRSLRSALGRFNLERTIADLTDHVIIVGYGRMGKQTAERLVHSGSVCVVVESDPNTLAQLAKSELLYIQGDGMAESTLIDAGIERASSILCLLSNDVDNVYVTLSARQLNPNIRIISKAEQQSSLRKLYQAGANHVVSPSTMGAMRVSNLVVNPLFAELLDAMNIGYGSTQVHLHEIRADQYPEMIDVEYQAIQSTFVGLKAVVVGIRHATGRVSFPAPLDHKMTSGDSLILLIRHSDMKMCDNTIQEKIKSLKDRIEGDKSNFES